MDMPFPEEEVWLVNWLGNWVLEGGGGIGRYTQKWSTYIHTHDRLDKLHSALAEAQLKTDLFVVIELSVQCIICSERLPQFTNELVCKKCENLA